MFELEVPRGDEAKPLGAFALGGVRQAQQQLDLFDGQIHLAQLPGQHPRQPFAGGIVIRITREPFGQSVGERGGPAGIQRRFDAGGSLFKTERGHGHGLRQALLAEFLGGAWYLDAAKLGHARQVRAGQAIANHLQCPPRRVGIARQFQMPVRQLVQRDGNL